MIELTPAQFCAIQPDFFPEHPGPLVGAHVAVTGLGSAWADRWPDPRAALVEISGNYTLEGDPAALTAADLQPLVRGMVDAPDEFIPVMRAAYPRLGVWSRVIATLDTPAAQIAVPAGAVLRALTPQDAPMIAALDSDLAWISKTWGGAAGLAASGRAWGAFVEDGARLVSLACTFFKGRYYEDLAVVTQAEYRGQGLGPACVAQLCQVIQAEGRHPSWTTSTDNRPSQRVAARVGFAPLRLDRLFVFNIPFPAPPPQPGVPRHES